jgi:hypothetical protein
VRKPELVTSVAFASFLLAFVSCGAEPDVPDETQRVSSGPHAPEEPAAAPVAAPAPSVVGPATTSELPPEGIAVGFAEGGRFVLVAGANGTQVVGASFEVVDVARGTRFRVLGAPMGAVETTYSPFREGGVLPGAPRLALVEDGHGRVLVRSPGGVQLVDLHAGGAMRAAIRADPMTAGIAEDGEAFFVKDADGVSVVRASDGAIARIALSTPHGVQVTLGPESVVVDEGPCAVVVDRATLRTTTLRAARDDGRAVASDGLAVALVAERPDPIGYDVRVLGHGRPTARVHSASFESPLFDKERGLAVWVERLAADEPPWRDAGFVHAVDANTGKDLRFALRGSGCGNAPEYVERIEDGKLVTDASCSLGCPSVRWSKRTIVYDLATGSVLSDTSVESATSWNEEMALVETWLESTAKSLGVDIADVTRVPDSMDTLAATPRGLVRVGPPGRVEIEGSRGASLASVALSKDGALAAGIVDGRAMVWDLVAGRALVP